MVSGFPPSQSTGDAAFAEAFHRATASLGGGWTVLPVILQAGGKLQGGLCRADRGIALIGRETNLQAVPEAKKVLVDAGFEKEFGHLPPILYRPLPPRELSLEEVLEAAFDLEPPLEVADRDAWLQAVCDAFTTATRARAKLQDDARHFHDAAVGSASPHHSLPPSPPVADRPERQDAPVAAALPHASETVSSSPDPDDELPDTSGLSDQKARPGGASAESGINPPPIRQRVPGALLIGAAVAVIAGLGLGWVVMSRYDDGSPSSRIAGDGADPAPSLRRAEGSTPAPPSHAGQASEGHGADDGDARSRALASADTHPGPPAGMGQGPLPQAGVATDQPHDASLRPRPGTASPSSPVLPEVHQQAGDLPQGAYSTTTPSLAPPATPDDGLARTEPGSPRSAMVPPSTTAEGRTAADVRPEEGTGHRAEPVDTPTPGPPSPVPANQTSPDASTLAARPDASSVEEPVRPTATPQPDLASQPAQSVPGSIDQAQPQAGPPAARPDAGSVEEPVRPSAMPQSDPASPSVQPVPGPVDQAQSQGSPSAVRPEAGNIETSLPQPPPATPHEATAPPDETDRLQTRPRPLDPPSPEPNSRQVPERVMPAAPATPQSSQSVTTTTTPAPPTDPASAPSSTRSMSREMLTNLMRRGSSMLEAGDISAARLLFKRAAEAGSATAATALGKTYDPDFLNGIGARSIAPDKSLARQWYEQGIARGDSDAARLLQQLNGLTPSP